MGRNCELRMFHSLGCTLIEIQPPERLVFTWNFPPTIPELRQSGAQTQVILTLKSLSDTRTQVSLVQSGWKDGPAWEEGYAYFDSAWTRTRRERGF